MSTDDNDISYSRTYRHSKCGGHTIVYGDTLRWLADPFLLCTGTYCSQCKKYGRLGAFTWADTGESVAARRRRLRRSAPGPVKVWGWLIGPLILAGAGAAVTWLSTSDQREAIGVAIALWVAAWSMLASLLAKKVWKINFRAAP